MSPVKADQGRVDYEETTNKYNQSIKELNEYATSSHLMSYRNHYVWSWEAGRGWRAKEQSERTFLFLMTFNQGHCTPYAHRGYTWWEYIR